MSEPNQGLPAPAGQPQGISPQPGQPQPAQTPAPATPPTQAAPQNPPPPAQPAPDLAKIQKERDEAIAYARTLQGERDRLRAVVAGPQQPDPMLARIKDYTDAGYSEQDARFMIRQIDQAVQPLQQQNQQLHAQIQGTTFAQDAYQQAFEANPNLFADPAIAQVAWRALQDAALRGDPRYVTAQYAEAVAAQEYALKNKPWAQNTPPPPAPLPGYMPRPMAPLEFNGPGSQYSPQPPMQPPSDPNVDALADKMASRWTNGKTLSQLQQPKS